MQVERDERTLRPLPQGQTRKKGDNIVMELVVPGYKKEDIEVKVSKKLLQVFGESCENYADGRWTDGFYLGERITDPLKLDITSSDVEVTLSHGMLTLSFPVDEEHKATTLDVKE